MGGFPFYKTWFLTISVSLAKLYMWLSWIILASLTDLRKEYECPYKCMYVMQADLETLDRQI